MRRLWKEVTWQPREHCEGVHTHVSTQPDVASGEEVESTNGPAVRQQHQQPQQQHAPGVETLGGDGVPESDLDITGVDHAEKQQEPSAPVTIAKPFPLLLDKPDTLDGDDSGVAVRRKPSVIEELVVRLFWGLERSSSSSSNKKCCSSSSPGR